MALSLNTQGTDPNATGTGFTEACDCHFVVESVEDFSGDKGFARIEVTFISLTAVAPKGSREAGKLLPSQVGKKRTEKFPLTPPPGSDRNPISKLLHFFCAIGLYSKPQWDADTKAGVNPTINEQDAIGRTLCAPVSMKPFYEDGVKKKIEKCKAAGDTATLAKLEEELAKYSGKSFPSIGGDWNDIFWAIGDPEAEHVPLDPDSIAQFNGNLPTKQGINRRRGEKAPVAGTPPLVNQASTPPAPTAGASFF